MFVSVSQKYKTFLFQKVHSNVLRKWMLRDCGPSCQTCFGIGIFLKGMRSAYWRKVVQRNLIWNFYGEKTALLGKNQDFLGNRRKVTRSKLWKKVVLSSLTFSWQPLINISSVTHHTVPDHVFFEGFCVFFERWNSKSEFLLLLLDVPVQDGFIRRGGQMS